MSTGHSIFSSIHLDYSIPLLLVGGVYCFIVFVQLVFDEKLSDWGFTMSKHVMEVDENLPNFFSAVKLSDADWIVNENKHLRETYGF